MKSIYDSVNFYESIKQEDLFPDSVFSIDLITDIEKQLYEKNKEFFKLIENQALDNTIGYKALQIAYDNLDKLYWDWSGGK